jgi:hypothetical protein
MTGGCKLFAIVVVASAAACGQPATPRPEIAIVFTMIDLDEIRFTNDSRIDLADCRIQIQAPGFNLGRVGSLPVSGRATLSRATVAPGMPRDEFYARLSRAYPEQFEMGCRDAETGAFVEVAFRR